MNFYIGLKNENPIKREVVGLAVLPRRVTLFGLALQPLGDLFSGDQKNSEDVKTSYIAGNVVNTALQHRPFPRTLYYFSG